MSGRIQLPRWGVTLTLVLALSIGGLAGWIAAGFTPVVRSALPAVVNICSPRIVRAPEGGPLLPFNNPLFRGFFGDEFSPEFAIPRERREQSLGSGVIVSPDGYLLTNHHVVQESRSRSSPPTRSIGAGVPCTLPLNHDRAIRLEVVFLN